VHVSGKRAPVGATGYFRPRTVGGQVVGEQKFGRFGGYTKVTAPVG
jgi:hypothetical protein